MSSPRQTFHYQRKLSLGSSLWSLWLYLPAHWRGRVYRTALRVLAEQIPFSKAYRLPRLGCYLKLCPSADEALATEYVRTHTSIPVPQILDVVHLPEGLAPPSMSWLILMTVLPGTPLFVNGSGHRLRDAEDITMKRVGDILRGWLAQLRGLESPFDERVCGFTGGSFRNFRMSQDPVGPFASVAELHAHQSLSMPPAELALRPASKSNPNLVSSSSGFREKP